MTSFLTTSYFVDKLCVVIPMKSPKRSKQRLAGSLSDAARESLSLTLFENTLAFFQRHFPMLDVLVVSESLEVLALAQTYEANTLFEDGEKGLNGALYFACDWVKQSGYDSQLIVPSDIAALNPEEILSLLKEADDASVVIGVAKDGGTNALLTSPPDAIQFEYGCDSAAAHRANAVNNRLICRCLHLANLALDIDQSEDLKVAVIRQPERFNAWGGISEKTLTKERQYA
ncbi:2-phospho-L-lactate guanylyltransferase [Marinomonas rhizomae]|uniref:2-phospho-L-lactate guanylyltransferase n=1 Tax=Marinomonas rhizomae TaxID=491948 RepID=A0A366ITT8_9GAMM|nr:2-phospho-L-lactate guanylyltransferase [Marinomonas rhizomae]RBP78221.1 2-phospho-L-lactate guanylyltransferase [Marinomonas rhizomae]RNF69829.1 2-phospho-L-lactate guanylyltransferase [Marinomonas rhizomae]